MARFYGTVDGKAKTTASRLGSKKSGLTVRGNGWSLGGYISLMENDEGDKEEDLIRISLTSGSSYEGKTVSFGTFTREDLDVLADSTESLSNMIYKFIGDQRRKAKKLAEKK